MKSNLMHMKYTFGEQTIFENLWYKLEKHLNKYQYFNATIESKQYNFNGFGYSFPVLF